MEIEKKFLTKKIPFNLDSFSCLSIAQSYISFSPTIRIRKSNSDFYLTVKGVGHECREELELSISAEEYTSLQKKTEGVQVIKKRYLIPIDNGLTAEFDIYEGNLSGLFTTEVEFKTKECANNFIPPIWFGRDISNDSRYKNTALSKYGLPND